MEPKKNEEKLIYMFLLIHEWFVPSTEASNFELWLLNFFFAAKEVLLLGPFYSLITKFKIRRHSRMDEFQIRHTIGKIMEKDLQTLTFDIFGT